MTFGFVFPYSLLKLQTRKQLEYLRKNAAYSTQGGFLLQLRLFWSNSIYAKEGSAFIHFSKANLDKLVACYVSTLGFKIKLKYREQTRWREAVHACLAVRRAWRNNNVETGDDVDRVGALQRRLQAQVCEGGRPPDCLL